MKDYIRSLIFGIVLLFVSIIYIVMNSYKIAAFSGILSVAWLGKAFVEWWKNKK